MKPRELTIGEKAKSILLERGWRQGPYGAHNDTRRVCMVEALAHAALPALLAPNADVFGLTAGTIQGLGFRCTPEAVDWNDAPERTFEDVLERLERI